MHYWLIKSEPNVWSWDDQVKAKKTEWSGVRNHQAANYMKAMKKGDSAFFYHSNIGKAIVGTVEITAEAYPDSSDEAGRFVMVDVKVLAPLARPITLDEIKRDPALADMALLKQSRLSVQPVTAAEWKHINQLSKK